MNAPSGEKCRIAHVSLGLETGGMEKLLVEFARRADRQRFQLHFICLEGRGTLADEVESLGWKLHTMHKAPGFRPALVLRLAWLFRCLRVDVVHTHNEPGCIYGVPAARLAGVPSVLNTQHGRICSLGTRRSRAFAIIGRLADRLVCVSREIAGLTLRAGIRPDRILTIWNGIDTETFTFHGPSHAGPAVFVGRLSRMKDIETLIRAVPLVLQHIPAFRLRIVGDGPARPSLEALAESLAARAHVEFIGETKEVRRHLAEASVFVLPSLTEGVSIALLEAMATGLPVVATRVGGNIEVVLEGETGILIPPREPASLAFAVVSVLLEFERARQMGIAGRRRAEAVFNVRSMMRAYESLYEQSLPRTKRYSR
jgi:glycosyltransferase involved in cell wall biosynthesis